MDPDLMGDDFTPSMDQKLNQLNAAAGAVGDDLDKGNLSPEDHNTLMGQIQPQRQALMGAKQNAMQKALEQQKKMTMDQNSFQTAMEERDRAFHASSFHDRLVHVGNPFDPEQTQTGYVNHKGDFEPIEFPEKEQPEQSEDKGATPYSPLGAAAAELALGGTNGTSPNSPPQTHTMDINVGDQQSRATFDQGAGGWQQTGQQRFNNQTGKWEDMPIGSAMGGTPQAPATGQHGELSEGEIRAIGAQAQVAARSLGLRPGSKEFNDFAQHTAGALLGKLQDRKAQDLEARRKEGAAAEEHRKQEAAKSEKAKADLEEKQNKAQEALKQKVTDTTNKAFFDFKNHYSKERQGYDARMDKATTDSDRNKIFSQMPAHLADEKTINAKAWEDAQEHAKRLHPEAFQKTEMGRAEGAPAQPTGGVTPAGNKPDLGHPRKGEPGYEEWKAGNDAALKEVSNQVNAPKDTSQAEAFMKHITESTKHPGEGTPDKRREKPVEIAPLSRFGVSKFD